MRWIKILFWILLIYGISSKQPIYTSSAKTDNRQAILERFFQKYHSPASAKEYLEASKKYDLDFRLLPAIAVVESTLCKNYQKNCFGWGRDRIYATPEDVARGLTTLSYYRKWQSDRNNITLLANVYNPSGAEKWAFDVQGIISQLN